MKPALRRSAAIGLAAAALILPLAGSAQAGSGYPPCGDACNWKDPQTYVVTSNGRSYHCADDAVTVDQFLYRGRTVQLRYSNRCETVWGRGFGLYNGDMLYTQVKSPITGAYSSDGTVTWDYEYTGPGDGWTPMWNDHNVVMRVCYSLGWAQHSWDPCTKGN